MQADFGPKIVFPKMIPMIAGKNHNRVFFQPRIAECIHHFADLMVSRIEELRTRLGLDITISDERDLLLETGGGLKKAESLLTDNDQPILIVNVDVLHDLDFHLLEQELPHSNALAVLAVRNRKTSRYLVWDSEMHLKGWVHKGTGEVKGELHDQAEIEQKGYSEFAFSGIQVISPDLFPLIRQTGKFSIIETYLDLIPTGRIKAHPHSEGVWLDVGKPETLQQASGLMDRILPPSDG